MRWIRGKRICLTAKSELDWATIDQLGLSESDLQSPAISSSYRSSNLSKPNQTVLEAQARVCTGPTQTRPLSEEQAFKVLDTILRSGTFFLISFLMKYHVVLYSILVTFCSSFSYITGGFGVGGNIR